MTDYNFKGYPEVDAAMEAVFNDAMEADHIISKEVREKLPDDCFAIIRTLEDGSTKRSYPLRVPGNKPKTLELTQMAITMFHYCNPDWKKQLAQKIVETINKEQLKVTISPRNQLLKFYDKDKLPKCVIIANGSEKK